MSAVNKNREEISSQQKTFADTIWIAKAIYYQADKLVLLTIIILSLADVSPTHSSGLPQGNVFNHKRTALYIIYKTKTRIMTNKHTKLIFFHMHIMQPNQWNLRIFNSVTVRG